MKRFVANIWWVLPIVFMVAVYADGLRTWFAADDFAWLSLLHQVHNAHEVVHALFAPAAQGTIRPWSERGFFMLFERLFGLDSLPFRLCVFTTMAVDVLLVAWLALRLTGSRVAGFMAPVLWTANAALVTVLTWTSAYNEALCALFLLGALALLIRYIETGRRAFWWWQVVVFVLGFGALEINVVYPALAAAYIFFVVPATRRKELLVRLTPLFAISAVYYAVHRHFAPIPHQGPYAFAVDSRILGTLATYFRWSLLPGGWVSTGYPRRIGSVILIILAFAIVVWLASQLAHRKWRFLFYLSWFLLTLGPMLPLPNHLTDYYLTMPTIGLALLGAEGVAAGWRRSVVWKSLAVALPAIYLCGMLPVDRLASRWWLDRSLSARGLVLGAAAAQKTHPGKAIVIDHVDSDTYSITFADNAMTYIGLKDVWLTPAAADVIHPENDGGRFSSIVLDPATLRNAITHDQVVIYSFLGDHLRNVTEPWERANFDRLPVNGALPERVDIANPLLAYLVGPEWLPPESDFRWMPQKATVRLGGPRRPSDELLVEGYCPGQQLSQGPLHLMVSVDGIALPATQIAAPESNFRRLFEVPSSLIGRKEVVVTVSVDRTFRDPAGRDLGLVFGTVAFGAFDR